VYRKVLQVRLLPLPPITLSLPLHLCFKEARNARISGIFRYIRFSPVFQVKLGRV
jgi:hypothetical protein